MEVSYKIFSSEEYSIRCEERDMFGAGKDECFVSRGKVTDIKTEKEEQSCVIQ